MVDQRGQLLRAALGFAGLRSADGSVLVLRSYLDSWAGIGRIAVGMAHQGFDLQLTRYDERGWRATFYTTGMEHSPTGATGTGWEPTRGGRRSERPGRRSTRPPTMSARVSAPRACGFRASPFAVATACLRVPSTISRSVGPDDEPDGGGLGSEASRICARTEAAIPVSEWVGFHFDICGEGHADMESGLLEIQGELELPVSDHRRGSAPMVIDVTLANRPRRLLAQSRQVGEAVAGEGIRGRSADMDTLVGNDAGEIEVIVDAQLIEAVFSSVARHVSGHKESMTVGQCIYPDGILRRVTAIQTQAPVKPGDSGGPLLDEAGAVVGIVVGSATDTDGVYFAVAVQHVPELLSR